MVDVKAEVRALLDRLPDDCSYADDGCLRELLIECSDEALVSFHNELGFQPKDLYAMCQVGESSKRANANIGGLQARRPLLSFTCPDTPSPPRPE